MAADHDLGDLIYEIRIPLLLAMAWAVLGIVSEPLGGPVVDALWFMVRVGIFAAAGYLATRRGKFALWQAAFAGIVLMFADHVLVKGISFLLEGEVMAMLGVLVSYVMFFWVAAMITLVGGIAGRVAAKRSAAI